MLNAAAIYLMQRLLQQLFTYCSSYLFNPLGPMVLKGLINAAAIYLLQQLFT